MDPVILTDSPAGPHVAELVLNRPDKRNAVSYEMVDALIAAVADLAGRPDLRAVVLRGEGAGFCSGLDTANFRQLGEAGESRRERLESRSHGDANKMQHFALCLTQLPVPVIAALHGQVFGAGFQLALGADMRIAAPGTKMSVMETKWGLVPDMGGMVLMPRLTGTDVIRRLTYTADVIEAERMLAWGLVTELAEDPLAAAREIAATIAGRSPSAVRAAKALIARAETAAPAEVLRAETEAQLALIGNAHQREILAAAAEGRAPRFA